MSCNPPFTSTARHGSFPLFLHASSDSVPLQRRPTITDSRVYGNSLLAPCISYFRVLPGLPRPSSKCLVITRKRLTKLNSNEWRYDNAYVFMRGHVDLNRIDLLARAHLAQAVESGRVDHRYLDRGKESGKKQISFVFHSVV